MSKITDILNGDLLNGIFMLWVAWKAGIPFQDQYDQMRLTQLASPVWADYMISKLPHPDK